KTDPGYYDPSTATWTIQRSTLGRLVVVFGAANLDVPVVADYDGDGKADIAVYRPTDSRWLSHLSGGTVLNTVAGQPGSTPVPADYDGDGKADLVVYRSSESRWMGTLSGGTTLNTVFGLTGDPPAPADYDNDGKADLAVYRSSQARWLVQASSG